MKLEAWLKGAEKQLKAANIGTARLDVEVLLADELQKDRAWLLAHPEFDISATRVAKLNKRLVRRVHHEPLAYIRGFTEFYGRNFKLNKRVLEPRPESETMIDLLKEIKLPKKATLADIGTGSGAIGITAALELHNPEVDLYDIDAAALAVAKHNCVLHELHLHARKSDLFNRRIRSYSVLLANLPYVPRHWQINQSAKLEPRLAIDGGPDGLSVYRRFFDQLSRFEGWPKYVLTESLPTQHKDLAQIAVDAGFKQQKAQDFIQLFSR